MLRIVMMELGLELILLWSSPGRWNLLFHLLTSINPNFDWMPIVRSALLNHSDSSNMDANYILYLPPSGLTREYFSSIPKIFIVLYMYSICLINLRWPFSSSCTIVETHRRSSSQSNHRESDELNNHIMLVFSETTEGNDMPRGRASAKARNSIPYEQILNFLSNKKNFVRLFARLRLYFSNPLNKIPGSATAYAYEDSDTSSHKRKSHFEQQSTVIQNGSPKRQAVNRASKYSSCLISITDHDVMDSTHMGAQPSLESISTQSSSSFFSVDNIKLLFVNLIALSLEDLSGPEKETSMKKTLSILADNLSLFSEEKGEQLLELLFDFPALVHRWREYSRSHKDSQKSCAEMEKIRDLVKTSMKDEESLKVRYEELEKKEKELIRQLKAVQNEKAEIAEQRTEKSNQTKDLMEKAAHRKKDERLMRIVATKLNNLSDQWAKLQSVFI